MVEDTPNLSTVHVMTEEGPIFGFNEESDFGKFQCFFGIPYAKPPVGQLRFLPPVPMPPWKKEIDCTKTVELIDAKTLFVLEDCLYVNVKTKNIKPTKPLPVMFWVGGCKYTISLDIFLEPSLLTSEDVIFVNCGFRQGPFGYLSINEPVAPGNSGLKDIVMALKWVQRNIAIFGGDPNNVTLFGNSSGASMIHLMMLSSMSSGLFHKAIIQGASGLNNWALMKNPIQPALDLAKELGVTASYNSEIVEKLKTISEKEIFEAFMRLMHKSYLIKNNPDNDLFNPLFKPCIEEEFEGQVAFLTKSPALILKSGKFNKVPFIIGSNNIEASILQHLKEEFKKNYKMFNENLELIVPKDLAGEVMTSKKIGKQIMEFYIGEEENLREDTKEQYLQMISDYYYIYYINKSVRMHSQYVSENSPLFYYILNYSDDCSKECDFFNAIGVCGDLAYVFGIRTPDKMGQGGIIEGAVCKAWAEGDTACSAATTAVGAGGTCSGTGHTAGGPGGTAWRCTRRIRQQVVRMWTNFAKYGNPTPNEDDPLVQITWEPVQRQDRLNYLLIGSELTKGRNPFSERMIFWDKLHNEHLFLRALILFNDMGVKW